MMKFRPMMIKKGRFIWVIPKTQSGEPIVEAIATEPFEVQQLSYYVHDIVKLRIAREFRMFNLHKDFYFPVLYYTNPHYKLLLVLYE